MKSPILIDCQYVYPQFAAAYLLVENNRAIFVENNTTHSVPLLVDELKRQGLKLEQVDYLIITHVHLDHAGGSSALMGLCPNATLLVHPKAARHMIDPAKLVNSAKQVYGEQNFKKLYGEIGPIDSQRVRVMSDGEELEWGSRKLRFIYTRGHANHHFCIWDSQSNGIFTGDSFGLAYPALQKKGLFIFPSTSPTDFDPTEAKLSLQKILDTGAEHVYLTHFGEVQDLKNAAAQLLQHIEMSEKLLNTARQKQGETLPHLEAFCEQELQSYYQAILEQRGLSSDREAWDYLKMDLKLNAAGIAYVASKR